MIEATMKEKVKEFIVKNFKWIILFICLIGFLAIAENVFNKEIMNGDIVGYKLISTFLISDFATPIAKFITNFGDAIFLTVLNIPLKNPETTLHIERTTPQALEAKLPMALKTFATTFLTPLNIPA